MLTKQFEGCAVPLQSIVGDTHESDELRLSFAVRDGAGGQVSNRYRRTYQLRGLERRDGQRAAGAE